MTQLSLGKAWHSIGLFILLREGVKEWIKGHLVGDELLQKHRGCYQKLNVIR